MKKARLYTWTLLGISLIVLIVGLLTFRYFYLSAQTTISESKMTNAQRESREVGRLLEQQLQSGLPREKVIQNLQQSILNTDAQSEYLCMYNQKGVELCNPNPALVGKLIDTSDSKVKRNEENIPFSELLKEGKSNTTVRNFPKSRNRASEIVSVYPVIGTDWMVATHANIGMVQSEMDNLFRQFLLGTILMIIVIAGLCYLLIRLIYRKYEQATDLHIASLNKELNELNVMNNHLKTLQSQSKPFETVVPENEEDIKRKRMLVYEKNELISIETQEISWIYLDENTLILTTFLQKKYTINGSLDELMKQLDNDIFYRVNRQCILNVNAIKSILLFGRNQLEILTNPTTPKEIIISKNKVAEFKNWLDR
ncbi:MAG: LytTR family DNA-binding domain-containing protein [Arachidicoccus sp.]|nr:LytTR family DNA-binding domain-containing protein [Arachidicoccus sp.]